jgi:nicotinamide mononucleotide transporter
MLGFARLPLDHWRKVIEPEDLEGFPAVILQAFQTMSGWEVLAVVLALAYLVLVIRLNALCWPAAILSAIIYTVLMYGSGLYMQSVLQLFYIAMAAYGWRSWRTGDRTASLPVVRWPWRRHFRPLALIAVAGLATGWLLATTGEPLTAYLDALTAWGAIVATWLVAQRVIQNWAYWFIIDGVLVWLYATQGLVLTAFLFGIYLVLIVIGYRQWRTELLSHAD